MGDSLPTHFLSTRQLDKAAIHSLFNLAADYLVKNRTANKSDDALAGKTVVNMFFEHSTRTRVSFEIAAKRLGADVINMEESSSSLNKGESFADTAKTLNAMQIDAITIRHPESGGAELFSRHFDCPVINAGDGSHEHPTQALLDAFSLSNHLAEKNKKTELLTALEGKTIAICGDIAHSRVARSNLWLLKTLGAKVRFIAPVSLMPKGIETLGAEVCHSLTDGIKDADAIMMLRVQHERMRGLNVSSNSDYARRYCLTRERIAAAKDGIIVMHPGPMNRGVEIASNVADDKEISIVLEQVEAGVAMRQAVLENIAG